MGAIIAVFTVQQNGVHGRSEVDFGRKICMCSRECNSSGKINRASSSGEEKSTRAEKK